MSPATLARAAQVAGGAVRCSRPRGDKPEALSYHGLLAGDDRGADGFHRAVRAVQVSEAVVILLLDFRCGDEMMNVPLFFFKISL